MNHHLLSLSLNWNLPVTSWPCDELPIRCQVQRNLHTSDTITCIQWRKGTCFLFIALVSITDTSISTWSISDHTRWVLRARHLVARWQQLAMGADGWSVRQRWRTDAAVVWRRFQVDTCAIVETRAQSTRHYWTPHLKQNNQHLKWQFHIQLHFALGLTWEEVEASAQDRHSWRQRVALCIGDAGWIKVKVKVKVVNLITYTAQQSRSPYRVAASREFEHLGANSSSSSSSSSKIVIICRLPITWKSHWINNERAKSVLR